MTNVTHNVVPATIQVDRTFDRDPGVVFDAYRQVDDRLVWLPDPNGSIAFDSHTFSVGGSDQFSYQSHDGPKLFGSVHYELIADDALLVYVRRVTDSANRPLTVSIVRWELSRVPSGTSVAYTQQTMSLVGSLPIEGRKYRVSLMLDRLADHVGSA